MRQMSVLVVVLSLFTVSDSAGAAPFAGPDSLQTANQALEGRLAVVTLATGEVLRGATRVVMGPESTQMALHGETRHVATEEIARIAIAKNSRIKRWARRGLAAGAVLGVVGFGYSEVDGAFVSTGDLEDAAAGALAGAAVGAGAAALAGQKTVYEAGS